MSKWASTWLLRQSAEKQERNAGVDTLSATFNWLLFKRKKKHEHIYAHDYTSLEKKFGLHLRQNKWRRTDAVVTIILNA